MDQKNSKIKAEKGLDKHENNWVLAWLAIFYMALLIILKVIWFISKFYKMMKKKTMESEWVIDSLLSVEL